MPAETHPTRWAGYREHRVARSTGTLVVLVNGEEAGLDTDGGLWSTICDAHDIVIAHDTRALARSWMSAPEQWCEECQAAVG